MSKAVCHSMLSLSVLLSTSLVASAQDTIKTSTTVKTVFVIAMENHNWTQPANTPGFPQQIYLNPNAPFINSLVNGTAVATINGQVVNISGQTSYATAYHTCSQHRAETTLTFTLPNRTTSGRK